MTDDDRRPRRISPADWSRMSWAAKAKASEREIRRLRESVERDTARAEGMKKARDRARNDLARLTDECQMLDKEIADAQRIKNEEAERLKAIQAVVRLLTEDIDTARRAEGDKTRELAMLRSRITARDKEIRAANEKGARQKNTIETELVRRHAKEIRDAIGEDPELAARRLRELEEAAR